MSIRKGLEKSAMSVSSVEGVGISGIRGRGKDLRGKGKVGWR